jgi:hypothetical protein
MDNVAQRRFGGPGAAQQVDKGIFKRGAVSATSAAAYRQPSEPR